MRRRGRPSGRPNNDNKWRPPALSSRQSRRARCSQHGQLVRPGPMGSRCATTTRYRSGNLPVPLDARGRAPLARRPDEIISRPCSRAAFCLVAAAAVAVAEATRVMGAAHQLPPPSSAGGALHLLPFEVPLAWPGAQVEAMRGGGPRKGAELATSKRIGVRANKSHLIFNCRLRRRPPPHDRWRCRSPRSKPAPASRGLRAPSAPTQMAGSEQACAKLTTCAPATCRPASRLDMRRRRRVALAQSALPPGGLLRVARP